MPAPVVIPSETCMKLIDRRIAFEAIRAALIAAADGSGSVNPVVIGRGLNDGETFSMKSGLLRGLPAVGLKVGGYWPGNDAKGLPRHQSAILLLAPASGRLMAVVEGGALNGLRTAAADAVAASVLARADAATLAIFGAGKQALHEVRAICDTRPIRRVFVASRNAASADAMSAALRGELPPEIQIASADAEHAARGADIIVTATPARAPLFDAAWVRPGTHVASMGSDQVGKQELPPALFARARLFCDLPQQAVVIGEMQHAKALVDGGQPLVAIGDVLRGAVAGRTSDDEITIFDSSGIALQDLAIAAAVLARHATT
jgi:ornithine cyclodeaminase